MTDDGKPQTRRYRAPKREAAAERTREAIVQAAKQAFEQYGWAGTTLRMIAAEAGISQKSIEAIYRTKTGLLEAVVEYAIRGDIQPIEIQHREAVAAMEAVADAATMLDLHAAHLRRVNERAAGIAWVVEHAAAGGGSPSALWARMNHNRTAGVRWATRTLLAKPGTDHLESPYVESVVWVALDWSTYRTLTQHAGLDGDQYEAWLGAYYRLMLGTAG